MAQGRGGRLEQAGKEAGLSWQDSLKRADRTETAITSDFPRKRWQFDHLPL
jgi:hypothetical protein